MNDWITKIQGQRTKTLAAAFLATSIASPVAAEDSTSPEASSQIIAAETELKKTTDSLGIKLWGYMRGGFYGALHGAPKAQYQLGGDLQHYRLGNEGDTYLEFGIGKQWDVGNGLKWGTYYMPTVYNGTTGTAQLFTDISGLEFAPAVSLWAGQRYHRIADIHIVDHWLMEDGDNFGAGADGIPLASGQLNLAVYSGGSMNNHDTDPNNAKRANFQLRNLAVNPGGKLTLTGGVVRGQFREGSGGGALGLMHQQSDFIVAGLDNFFFLQGSRGHSALSGKFHGLDTEGTPQPGARQVRIADAINWQVGRFGGQALIGWQSLSPDDASPGHRDFSMGGRVTYGMGRHTKLEAELGLNQRSVRGQAHQQLGKATLAVAFAPDTDFWTRPELRLYVTHARWNDAARIANTGLLRGGWPPPGHDFRRPGGSLVGVTRAACPLRSANVRSFGCAVDEEFGTRSQLGAEARKRARCRTEGAPRQAAPAVWIVGDPPLDACGRRRCRGRPRAAGRAGACHRGSMQRPLAGLGCPGGAGPRRFKRPVSMAMRVDGETLRAEIVSLL